MAKKSKVPKMAAHVATNIRHDRRRRRLLAQRTMLTPEEIREKLTRVDA